jgi:Tfp pilus assembly protein PilF
MKNLNEVLIEGVEATLDGEYEKAVTIFTEALKVYKDNHVIYYNLGIVFMNMEKYSEASEILEKALVLNNEDPDIWTEAAYAWQRMGNREKAILYYNKALKKADDKSVILNNIGTLYFSDENYSEAKKYFLDALNENSDYTEARQNLALTNTFLDVIR